MEAITLSESKRFVELEKTIERGKKTFVEVGTALAEIRDSKLYRSDFDTFEEYCKEKWGWNRAYAGKLIDAADVVKSIPENVSHGIQNERQARELAKVEPEKRAEVLTIAAEKAESEDRPLTARDIQEVAKTNDEKFVEALGGTSTVEEIEAREENVTAFYDRLESVISEAFMLATDKQLISMSVYAAKIPKLIKDELAARKKKS